MTRLAELIVAASLAAQAFAPASAAAKACDVSVRFGSFAMGINHPVADRIEAAARRDRDLRRVSPRQYWGREGEFDLCMAVKPGRDAKAVFARYRMMLPERDRHSWSQIDGPGGLTYRTAAK